MKTLYLMRHGQTMFNVAHKIQGWCDAPLTDLGRQQAEIAGQWFRDHNVTFDYAFSSTSERAADTLEIVTGGNLQIGKKDIAGECANYMKILNFSEDRFDLARTPEGIIELITKVTLPMICTIGPDTLAVYCDLLTDTEELKGSLKKYIPERHIPEIHKLNSNLWEVFYGGGVLLYNLLHGSITYREDLKEFRQ